MVATPGPASLVAALVLQLGLLYTFGGSRTPAVPAPAPQVLAYEPGQCPLCPACPAAAVCPDCTPAAYLLLLGALAGVGLATLVLSCCGLAAHKGAALHAAAGIGATVVGLNQPSAVLDRDLLVDYGSGAGDDGRRHRHARSPASEASW